MGALLLFTGALRTGGHGLRDDLEGSEPKAGVDVRTAAVYEGTASVYVCTASVYGCTASIYGCTASVYGCTASMYGVLLLSTSALLLRMCALLLCMYGCTTAVYGSTAAIYGRTAAIFVRSAAIYGGESVPEVMVCMMISSALIPKSFESPDPVRYPPPSARYPAVTWLGTLPRYLPGTPGVSGYLLEWPGYLATVKGYLLE
eukprot:3854665-Rhodomonas_salina.1